MGSLPYLILALYLDNKINTRKDSYSRKSFLVLIYHIYIKLKGRKNPALYVCINYYLDLLVQQFLHQQFF